MRALARFLYFRVLGWTLRGSFPDLKQCVVIVGPHTSNWDFLLGLLARAVIGVKINYIGKDSLFRGPFGWFFRWSGGAPVVRDKRSDTVRNVVQIFREREVFRLALSPEGTRKKVAHWKTGFYYIAKSAGVPIVMVAFDFGKREIKISGPVETTDDMESDFRSFMEFYKGVRGKIPERGL